MKCKIIFITGVAHSGTTVLYRMLGQHPDICWFSQFSLRGGEIPGRFRLPFYAFINRTGRKYFKPSAKKESGFLRTMAIPAANEPHKVWDFLIPSTDFLEESDYDSQKGEQIAHICNLEMDHWRKDVLIVKLPRLSQAIAFLARALPNAYFINIERDAKSVVLSNADKFPAPDGEDALFKSLFAWRQGVVKYGRRIEGTIPKRMMTLSYEDFCEDVRGHLKNILSFVSVEINDAFLEQFPKTFTIANDKWFKDMSSEKKEALDAMAADFETI